MTSTLKECLSSLEIILPENAFYGYKFPNVIITDDSQSECQALSGTCPNTTHLLCIFHVLQSFWRWLHEGKNLVLKDHRQILLLKVKGLVYAHSEEQLNTRFQEVLSDVYVSSLHQASSELLAKMTQAGSLASTALTNLWKSYKQLL